MVALSPSVGRREELGRVAHEQAALRRPRRGEPAGARAAGQLEARLNYGAPEARLIQGLVGEGTTAWVGVVTLRGTAGSFPHCREAARAADAGTGVTGVVSSGGLLAVAGRETVDHHDRDGDVDE